MKKIIKKWWFWLTLVIMSTLIIYGVMSYLKPEMRFGFGNLLINSRTHTYKAGQEFKYGPYSITVKPEVSDIKYEPKDCSKKENQTHDFLDPASMRKFCESENDRLKEQTESHKHLTITINVKNYTHGIHSMNKDWFIARDNNGKGYIPIDVNHHVVDIDFNTDNILPSQSREGKFKEILIDKNLKEINFIISLPNSASQVVNLNL